MWTNQNLDPRSLTTREKIIIDGVGVCYVGRIGVSNAKMFQIEITKNVPIHQNYLKRFHGVEIRVLDNTDNKKDSKCPSLFSSHII